MHEQPSAVARFFGYAMIAVGALMTLLSGGCTLVGLYVSLTEKTAAGMAPTVLIVGLPCIAVGLGLFFGGRSLSRRPKPTQPPDKVF